MNYPTKYLWPTLAILFGCLAAWGMQSQASVATLTYSAAAAPERTAPIHERRPEGSETDNREAPGERIQGKIAETISVPNYTYLRLLPTTTTSKPAEDVWAAVASARVEVGQHVVVVGAQRMDEFTSKTLKRTFRTIYFGALEGAEHGQGDVGKPRAIDMDSTRAMPKGHPDMEDPARGVQSEHAPHGASTPLDTGTASAVLPEGHPEVPGHSPAMQAGMHGASAGDSPVPVGKVELAEGPLGKSVSEIVRRSAELAKKSVRVRGVIVKSTSGVLGKTFAHVRDGSGQAATRDHDLTITCDDHLTVGTTVLFEGTIATGKDFGTGYTYPVLLENARVVKD